MRFTHNAPAGATQGVADTARPSHKLTVTCTAFARVSRNTLRGFATIAIAEMSLSFRDVALHVKGDSRWVALPSKIMLDKNGHIIRTPDGKPKYTQLFEFKTDRVRKAFSQRVCEAVLEFAPDAFDQPAEAVDNEPRTAARAGS